MGNFTAGMLKNCKHSIEELVNKDQGFYFMNQIRGTPVYWKRFQHEVLAMIEQLGCVTFFLTLSCADLKWKELPEIISKLNKLKLPIEYLESMNYFEKCELLNRNPVLLARYFQHRIETFFQRNFINTIKHHWQSCLLCNKNRISGACLNTCSQFYMDSKSTKTFRRNLRNVY